MKRKETRNGIQRNCSSIRKQRPTDLTAARHRVVRRGGSRGRVRCGEKEVGLENELGEGLVCLEGSGLRKAERSGEGIDIL